MRRTSVLTKKINTEDIFYKIKSLLTEFEFSAQAREEWGKWDANILWYIGYISIKWLNLGVTA